VNPAATTVLFDLDGTISDSASGILASLRHAFAVHGLPPLDEATGRALLGPPFYESLPPLLGEVPFASVHRTYKEHHDGGACFDTSVYPGVETVLRALCATGTRLAVATSKPEYRAIQILQHLGLADCFEVIGGDTADGTRGTKALVIADVLHRLDHPQPSGVLMIGDRRHDVEGARAHGIDCLGAGWGYGLDGELATAGARAVCATPAELATALGVAADAAAS
jgi:phosphoglycolate phosphatase